MPSNTFMNLPIEKQHKILHAAIEEFSDKPFSEVSINKIIKNAEISRGSFYTYFTDKYDLLAYLLERFKNKMQNEMINMNKEVKGDLKELILSIHNHIYEIYQNQTHQKFFYNIIGYFQSHADEELKNQRETLPFLGDCDELYDIIERDQFKFETEKEIKQTIDIAFA
ncbi:MAG: TetR/AcrR family transcriptional regulator, partial [Candidatus Izemoplasmatales bacterium]|nr:TetR/AcrR family transcriptional regulator [Candidatus Izemoplasmatales bacterium]